MGIELPRMEIHYDGLTLFSDASDSPSSIVDWEVTKVSPPPKGQVNPPSRYVLNGISNSIRSGLKRTTYGDRGLPGNP
jgi:hypothetical protein